MVVSQTDSDRPLNLELFPCSGGMAKGFKDAGVQFDIAIEWMSDHCDSYEHNIGHRPLCMDVRDFATLVRMGHWKRRVGLLVADPPCTPWSRAGKRLGTEDERDMLGETCDLIALLQPDVYLIGNVPGLDDGPNLPIVQRLIGGLVQHGYCTADFARLDAANYGVPQHRVRPFWFGHKHGPCIQWPAPTHGDPLELRDQMTLPGVEALIPWVTCRQALGHLPLEELGRPVKLRKRSCNSDQHGSVADKPARVVGTSNLSDGNVLLPDEVESEFTIQARRGGLDGLNTLDEPSHAILKNTHGNGSILVLNDKHPPNELDRPSATLGAKNFHNGPGVLLVNDKHMPNTLDAPAGTIRSGGEGHSAPQVVLEVEVLSMEPHHPPSQIDEPAMTIRASSGGGANRTLQLDGEPPRRKIGMRRRDIGRTPQSQRVGDLDQPAATIDARTPRVGTGESHVLSLTGIPQAGEPPAREYKLPGQGLRVGDPDDPSATQRAEKSRVGAGADKVLDWPWDRPATTVQADDRLSPPGHHDETFAVRSLPNAIVISEKAATILQGFPEDWLFVGSSKDARFSQLGQAMPPPLAGAVARSVVRQRQATVDPHRYCDHEGKNGTRSCTAVTFYTSEEPVTPIKKPRKRATK